MYGSSWAAPRPPIPPTPPPNKLPAPPNWEAYPNANPPPDELTFDYYPKLDGPKPPIPPPDFKFAPADVEDAPKRELLAPVPNSEPPADADP